MYILAGILSIVGWFVFLFYGFCLILIYLGVFCQMIMFHTSTIHKNIIKDETNYLFFSKNLIQKTILGLLLIGLGQIFYILNTLF